MLIIWCLVGSGWHHGDFFSKWRVLFCWNRPTDGRLSDEDCLRLMRMVVCFTGFAYVRIQKKALETDRESVCIG